MGMKHVNCLGEVFAGRISRRDGVCDTWLTTAER